MIELKGEDKIKSEPRSGDRDQVSNLPPLPESFCLLGIRTIPSTVGVSGRKSRLRGKL